ncbi:MAG: hypothetical protein H5T86_01080, partial [Armatimonadetes bacterium]|nr:hypothetical protein [Armatimonadota bacterium]
MVCSALLIAFLSYSPPGPVDVREEGHRIAITSKVMSVAFDRSRSGQLVEVAVRDWAGQHRVAAAPIGDISVTAGGKEYRLAAARLAEWSLQDVGQGEYRLSVAPLPLVSSDGGALPITVKQEFTVFAEGAIFCDITMSADGTAPITRCSLEFDALTAEFSPLRLYVKPSGLAGHETEYLTPDQSGKTDQPVTHAGFMFGHSKGYCAGVEFVLEDQRRI